MSLCQTTPIRSLNPCPSIFHRQVTHMQIATKPIGIKQANPDVFQLLGGSSSPGITLNSQIMHHYYYYYYYYHHYPTVAVVDLSNCSCLCFTSMLLKHIETTNQQVMMKKWQIQYRSRSSSSSSDILGVLRSKKYIHIPKFHGWSKFSPWKTCHNLTAHPAISPHFRTKPSYMASDIVCHLYTVYIYIYNYISIYKYIYIYPI